MKLKYYYICEIMLLKRSDHATGVDTSDLAAKKDFIALKADVGKLRINKLVNVPTSFNNLKTKADDQMFIKKTNIADNDVIKNTKFNSLKTTVNNLEKKIPDATTLIHINQYNTDKQNLDTKIRGVDKKIPDASGLVTTTVSEYKNQ